ncbi:MAG: RNA polymerase II transcription factor B subunit 4 [Geoglossum simile]|nr:MAG: RNA polymerase II transcription factor B subunit 4 [Geoglossum simile]
MNEVDGSEHYERHSDEPPPSLLTIVLDTNPHAWSLLSPTLPLSKAIATILVFINAHLAFNYANKVAVVASHCQRAQWLYPSPAKPFISSSNNNVAANGTGDVQMENGIPEPSSIKKRIKGRAVGLGNTPAGSPAGQHPHSTITADDANKYRPFRLIEDEVMANLRTLIDSTTESDLRGTSTTMMAGALTLALAYINREIQAYEEIGGGVSGGDGSSVAGGADATEGKPGIQSRILVLSVSGDLAFQYIPIMNCIFAAQRKKIPIDICKIAGDTVFLQQASDATRGVYMHLQDPRGLLQYLMLAFLPDQTSRRHLIMPSQVNVDFRAACFCHKLVVDIGFVCSICLSIFCSPPEGAICLTCGTHLQLGNYGAKPAVVPRTKKKKRRAPAGGLGLDSVGGTPTSVGTPAPE